MSRWTRRVPAQLYFTVALLACGWTLHRVNVSLEGQRQQAVETGEIGPLPDGKVLRVLALGFERLVADLYWIRTLFYVGSEAADEAGYPSAERLAHLVTDLDPGFHSAYVLLSSVLGGLRYDPEAAIRLLEKGMAHSDYWRIYFLAGYYAFMDLGDYERGARYVSQASKRGGPPYLPRLAARLYAQSGRNDAAIGFLQERLREEKHPRIVRDLTRRLSDLLIDRDLRQLDAAIQRYRDQHGAAPARLAQLLETGLLAKLPLDPQGKPYLIRDGRAESQTPHEDLRIKGGGE
jgi:tetratricopeptide (TPR) repeat protein